LLGAAGSIAFYMYMKSKVNDAETAIANLASGGAGGITLPGVTGTSAASAPVLSAACAKAAACCAAMAAKTSPANGALAAQACARTYATFADNICTQQYVSLKTAASTMGATCE
jgi:hypothetical protein